MDNEKKNETTFYSMWGDYYSFLGDCKKLIANMVLNGNFEDALNVLKSEYLHVKYYMDLRKYNTTEIDDLFKKARNCMTNRALKGNLEKHVDKIREKLYFFEGQNNMLQPLFQKDDPKQQRRRMG